jgi:hypothetical protein
MRADEFIRKEDKLNEVLPLVGLAAKGVGGALARGAVKGAAGAIGRGLGRAAVGGIGAAAKGAVGMAAKPFQSRTGDTIGTPDNQNATPTDPAKKAAMDRIKDQSIKPNSEIELPTAGPGGTEKFKVSSIRGDEVEIENPNPAPGEPRKTVYKKDDIKKSMSL